MNTFWKTLYRFKAHHILLWTTYFAFWSFYYKNYYPSTASLLVVIGIYFVFNASPFYIVIYALIPRFLYQRKLLAFILLSLATVIFFSACLGIILYQLLGRYVPEVAANPQIVFLMALMSILTTVGALTAIKLGLDKVRSDGTAQRQERQRLESELQYLKAQVNPHFLFNAINSVYFLIKKNPDVAAETLIKLSDLLRFQLYDCSDERIPIEKEMEYLQNFVELEKIRKGGKVKVDFDGSQAKGLMIAPFMLIPFLENAFKHVSTFSNKENFIKVSINKENNKLKALFRNTSDNLVRHTVGGIGLKNVRRRLELLYPGMHTLSIKDEAGIFEVDLTVEIE